MPTFSTAVWVTTAFPATMVMTASSAVAVAIHSTADFGNDTLIGGLGTNVLNGGAGLDVFVFSGTAAGGGDIITDYSIVDDGINLDKSGFAAFTTGERPWLRVSTLTAVQFL